MYIYVHIYFVCMHVCMYLYVYVYVYIYIYMYLYPRTDKVSQFLEEILRLYKKFECPVLKNILV
jgi:hypothetical protein